MFKDVLRAMDFTLLSQIALVLFFLVFVAVVIRTWRRPKDEIDRQSQIPLSDEPVEPRQPKA
jgi:cbb3-type cytochrome oxidase subunit 3